MTLFAYQRSSAPRGLIFVLLLAMAGNVAGWLTIGLLPDEAYYWVWSQRLQAGYYDHPSLIAWLIRPFADLAGDAAWAVRIPALLSWAVGAWAVHAVAGRVFGNSRAAFLALLVWSTLPIVQVGFHVVTPDAPLIIFSALTYYLAARALADGGWPWWLTAGLAAGLAVASKYTGVLVAFGVLAALALTRDGRRYLAGPKPWLAAVAALAAFSPVLYWNWQHDWISFAFQLGHGIDTEIDEPGRMLGHFVGGQMAAVMPWTWAVMVAVSLFGAGTARPTSVRWLLIVGFWLPLLVFGAASLTTKGHPNWPVTAYLPGSVLLGGALARWLWPVRRLDGRPRRGAILTVLLLALVAVGLVNLLRFPYWLQAAGLELPPQRTQLSQSYGWVAVGRALREELDRLPGGEGCTVVGVRLQVASMLARELGDAGRVTAPDDTRLNQFHLWRGQQPLAEPPCLFVSQYEASEPVPESVAVPPWGEWVRRRTLENHNPDLSVRRYGFFVPDGSTP